MTLKPLTHYTTPLKITLIILICLFAFSLFRHLSYPLLWNDEAETIMYAARILRFGYPKIDDGHNYLYQLKHPNITLGFEPHTGAYIGTTWGHFYFATAGVALASEVSDIYLKTALLRLPFATIGFLGVLLYPLVFLKFLPTKPHRYLYFSLYLLLELLNISLVLHLREVRYYSLSLFLYAAFATIVLNRSSSRVAGAGGPPSSAYAEAKRQPGSRKSDGGRRLTGPWNQVLYQLAITLILILSFHTFYPTYFVLSLTLAVYGFTNSFPQLRRDFPNIQHTIYNIRFLLPILLSLIAIVPSIIFFHTLTISSAMSSYFHFSLTTYRDNLYHIFYYFIRYDFLLPALLLKLLVIRHLWNHRRSHQGSSNPSSPIYNIQHTTYFPLTLFFTHILLIARTPFWFERYVIMVEPLISISIITDLFFLTSSQSLSRLKSQLTPIAVITLLLIFSRYQLATNHLYELTHQYLGPIDYLVTYIRDHDPHPENLVVATNFEEDSLMYYLGSKVIIGYAQANLAADITQNPDLIIIRKDTGGDHNLTPFNTFLTRATYLPINFPIYDYPINQNPALYISRPHLFQTYYTNDPQKQLTLLVRSDLYPQFAPSQTKSR